MARTFGGVSTDRIQFPAYAAVHDLVTQSWSIWAYLTGAGGGGFGRYIDKSDGAGIGAMHILENGTAILFAVHRWDTTSGEWTIPLPSLNVWHHICITYDAGSVSNVPIMYVDGVSQSVTTVAAPAGTLVPETAAIQVGNRIDGLRNFAGRLAEGSAHNVILTPTEVGNLAAGRLANTQQAGALVWYAPIIGAASPEPNLASPGNPGVVTGTVQSAHPPVDAQPSGDTYVTSQQVFL